MDMKRASGILLHPTSFPGRYGIGDLGPAAYQFVDFLVAAEQSLWQILPLGPTSYGDSPYASFSSFAGNPLLISLDLLVENGDLHPSDLAHVPNFPTDDVDYGWVISWKIPLLEKAAWNFLHNASEQRKAEYEKFWTSEFQWLNDYAVFMTVKEAYDHKAQEEQVPGAMWSNYWDRPIRLRHKRALDRWRESKADRMALKKVIQYFFFQQWMALKTYANAQGITIIGDLPIFVAADSVDVWANRDLFMLDDEGEPTVVAGVPPDYFSETGQLWGNPLYNWRRHKRQGFEWWINRLKATLRMVDVVRIDHFRGFQAYWEVPADAETAINGQWVEAPGHDLFETIHQQLGDLPIIAEDLGVITPEVAALRDNFNFPGMKILQFAFDGKESGGLNANNAFLPHNHIQNCVVYTGTHDNDTTIGWYAARDSEEKDLVRRYLGRPDHDIAWEFMRMAMSSVANWTIIPMQDVLRLDSWARMNTPSKLGGNWGWRYQQYDLNQDNINMIRDLATLFGRNRNAVSAHEETGLADS